MNFEQTYILKEQDLSCYLFATLAPPPHFTLNKKKTTIFFNSFFVYRVKNSFLYILFKSEKMDALFWHDLVERCILHFAFIKMHNKNPQKNGFLKAFLLMFCKKKVYQKENGTKCPRFQPAADFNINMIKDIKNDKK